MFGYRWFKNKPLTLTLSPVSGGEGIGTDKKPVKRRDFEGDFGLNFFSVWKVCGVISLNQLAMAGR
jgi:hypothetical protein